MVCSIMSICKLVRLTNPNSILRAFSTSRCVFVKEIRETEGVDKKGKPEIVVEGFIKESNRRKYLLDPSFLPQAECQQKDKCHPLCRLPFVNDIKHTDVLILEQFADSQGNVIPREVTGLCHRQHFRINKLVQMAQKSGLMKQKDQFAQEKKERQELANNCYWDETTIDAQWLEIKRKNKAYSFQK